MQAEYPIVVISFVLFDYYHMRWTEMQSNRIPYAMDIIGNKREYKRNENKLPKYPISCVISHYLRGPN